MLPPFRVPRPPQLPDIPGLPGVTGLRDAGGRAASVVLRAPSAPPRLSDLTLPGVAGLRDAGPGGTIAQADSSRRQLMTLGLFVFGMDTLPYQALRHAVEWRHGATERHQARPAAQYLGPGAETITLSGLLVPEIAGSFGAFDRLVEMGDSGEDYPLMDGTGRVFGHFRIVKLDRDHHNPMAGGVPRQVGFTLDLERAE